MNRIIYVSISLILLTSFSYSQSCLPAGITFYTQAQVDSFQINYPNCNEIEGNVTIGAWGSDISNLTGLNVLSSIEGELRIWRNINLLDLTGLENLVSIEGNLVFGSFYPTGGLGVSNTSLISMNGLNNLQYVGGDLIVSNHDTLQNFIGLDNLDSIGGDLGLYDNNLLSSLTGLDNVKYIGGDLNLGYYFYLIPSFSNPLLQDLVGLGSLETINGSLSVHAHSNLLDLNGISVTSIGGSIVICDNNSLISLTGLNNLYILGGDLTVEGCNSLINFEQLGNLNSIGGSLNITFNSSITDLTGLDNVTTINGDIFIRDCAALTGFNGLDQLIEIGGSLSLYGNHSLLGFENLANVNTIHGEIWIWLNNGLVNLSGLDNIEASSITKLTILYNENLSSCNIQSICDYLLSPVGAENIGYNASGCNSKEEVVISCQNISIREDSNSNSIKVFPIPASDKLLIEGKALLTGPAKIQLFDVTGREVLAQTQEFHSTGTFHLSLDVSELPAGPYIIFVQTGESLQSVKVLIN